MPMSRSSIRALYRSCVFACLLALGVLLVRTGASASWIEQVYANGVYPSLRNLLFSVFAWWPIAASVVVIAAIVGLTVRSILRYALAAGSTWTQRLVHSLLVVVRTAAWVYVGFMVLWGFNYARPPLSERLGLQAVKLSEQQLWEELESTATTLAILRPQLALEEKPDASNEPLDQTSVARLQQAVRSSLTALKQPEYGRVRLRTTLPGALLRFGTSGVYFPLTGEAHVDHSLHPLQRSFTIAHELAHGHGITDEGEANFVAYLSLVQADQLYLRYCGHLTYYRYLGSAARRADSEAYAKFRDALAVGVRGDLDAINRANNRYRELVPELRDLLYDGYLKTQGVQQGMASYGRLVELVAAYRKTYDD